MFRCHLLVRLSVSVCFNNCFSFLTPFQANKTGQQTNPSSGDIYLTNNYLMQKKRRKKSEDKEKKKMRKYFFFPFLYFVFLCIEFFSKISRCYACRPLRFSQLVSQFKELFLNRKHMLLICLEIILNNRRQLIRLAKKGCWLD